MTFTKPQQHSSWAQRREILHKTEEKLHQCVFLCSFCASSNDWRGKRKRMTRSHVQYLKATLRVLWGISHHWNNLLRHTNSHAGTLHFHIQEPLVRLISFTATNRWSEPCSTWLEILLLSNCPGFTECSDYKPHLNHREARPLRINTCNRLTYIVSFIL